MKILSIHEIPTSVYRLQLSGDFPFTKAIAILPYLKKLGFEGVYCSPFYDSYSAHGYDVTNPNALNPQLGTMEDYQTFCELVKNLGMKQIIDVVPNHMGIKGGKNAWWQDVLENGPYSRYAPFFDINWNSEKHALQGKVLLPILEGQYGTTLEKQEIKLFYNNEGAFFFLYSDYPLPVAPDTYAKILEPGFEGLKAALGESHPDWQEYAALLELYRSFPISLSERNKKNVEGKTRLQRLAKRSRKVLKHIKINILRLNGIRRKKESFDALDHLLEAQFYRLSYWKVAHHEINYRRFFNIQEMAAICIEKENVFAVHHHWLFELIDQGWIQGLRIDHPDGLYDPEHYFERLRTHGSLFTVVEKVLDRKETLPSTWQVEGTVGYDYLNFLNGVFIKKENEKHFTHIYMSFIGQLLDFEEVVSESKKLCAGLEMVSEVSSLGLLLDRLTDAWRDYRDFTRFDLTTALARVIAFFPVYRTYTGPVGKVRPKDALTIKMAIKKAKQDSKDLDASIFDFLEKLLLCTLKMRGKNEESREFVLRFQQLTGPIMAKGMEDTAFYIYNRFISLNEVGGDPRHFGYSAKEFHHFNIKKRKEWPFGFLASSTHDTKRSEDVRMRLNVLSEIPEEWEQMIATWTKINQSYKHNAPSANAEYYIYQSLVGIWPKKLHKEEKEAFFNRLWILILKSIREAKQETNWSDPNLEYEEHVRYFLHSILNDSAFLDSFLPFQKKIDRLGALGSLSATALKIGSCGVVDVYQGNEVLQYCLMDPDSRQPIDFNFRKNILRSVSEKQPSLMQEDKMKCFLYYKGLHFRKVYPHLFLEGEYIPLRVRGDKKEHLIAFMRRWKSQYLIVAAVRFFADLVREGEPWPPKKDLWGSTEILLPKEWKEEEWTDLFSKNRVVPKREGSISAAELFSVFPVSYLYLEMHF